MVGIVLGELKMISTVVCVLLRRFIGTKIEDEIHAFPSNLPPPPNLPPPNSFTLPVCLKSTDRAICIGSTFFLVSLNQRPLAFFF